MTQEKCRIDKGEVKEAIRLNHLQNMKEAMQGEKLRMMAITDMRDRRPYTKYHVEEYRMAFRLEHTNSTAGQTCQLAMAEI